MARAKLERYLGKRQLTLSFFGSFWRMVTLLWLFWGTLTLAFGLRGIFATDVVIGETESQQAAMFYLYWADILYGVIALLMLGWIFFYTHQARCSINKHEVPPLGYESIINQTLDRLCASTGILRSSISLFYAQVDRSVNASVITQGSRQCLVVSMGLIKVLKNDPTSGASILAHELGHLNKKDPDLFLYTTAYAKVILFAAVPLNLTIAVLLALTGNIDGLVLPATDIHTLLVCFFWMALINTALLLFVYFILRAFRYQSELQADSFACIHGSVAGVEAYLSSSENKTTWLSNLFDEHPALETRRQNVK